MGGALAFIWSRANWYKVNGVQPRWRDLGRQAWDFVRQGRRPLLAAGLAAVVVAAVWLLGISWSALVLLVVVLLLAAALAGFLTWLRGGDRLLFWYLKSDPRLVRTIDCFRRLCVPRGHPAGTLLAEARLVGGKKGAGPLPPADARALTPRLNPWAVLFRAACLPGACQVLRFLADRRCLTELDSRYLRERHDHERAEAWCAYQRSCYGASLAEYAAGFTTGAARPVEAARRQRLRWLALTEALAERYAFVVASRNGSPAEKPDWLGVAALLSQAGEVQLEFLHDARRDKINHDLQPDVRLAVHFFNLSARCLEQVIEPTAGPRMPAAIPGRAQHFCGPLAESASGDEHADSETAHDWTPLRRALLWQYVLTAYLQRNDAEPSLFPAAGPDPVEWLEGPASKLEQALWHHFQLGNQPWSLELKLTQATAFAALALERGRGEEARLLLLDMIGTKGHPGSVAQGADILAVVEIVCTRRKPRGWTAAGSASSGAWRSRRRCTITRFGVRPGNGTAGMRRICTVVLRRRCASGACISRGWTSPRWVSRFRRS